MTDIDRVSIRVERNVLIPLRDGVSLAANLFLPDAPGEYPALASYYPYHKDDLIGALFDHPNRYFAERGYATLLVDLRGLGNSDGVAWDVGDPREDDDGAQIVEWVAAQAWCDGNVGMWGMSYGGITAFKTAAQRPPHLKAIVPMCGTLDHYSDLVYPGGCLNCLGVFGAWGPFMTTMNLAPPMYQDVGGRWDRVWKERLAAARAPYVMPYQEYPAYGEYWQSKSTDAERIDVPTFLIGAWRDIFPEAMIRAYERIRAPKRLLMGPWMHEIPDLAQFAQVDYLALMLRWWDRWLKGEANGVEADPPVTIYVQQAGWRGEREWPIARTEAKTVYVASSPSGARVLTNEEPESAVSVSYRGDPSVGVAAGLWDPTGAGLGAPLDQGKDDLRSVAFTGDPLLEDLEITGSPSARMHVALDEGDDFNLVVKLCDVAPDGHSTLITTGWLKGSHRLSRETPELPPKGEILPYEVALWATSYRVQAGHSLRVAIACSDFPRIWPTPTNPLIRLSCGGLNPSLVRLPVVGQTATDAPVVPEPDPGVRRTPFDVEGHPTWTISHDYATDTTVVTTGVRSVLVTPNEDGRFEIERRGRASVPHQRPDAVRVEGQSKITLRTPGGSTVIVEGELLVTLHGEHFAARVDVDGQTIFQQRWER